MGDLQELWNNDREQLRQVREQLAAVTADRNLLLTEVKLRLQQCDAERAAHAETRKALDDAAQQMADFAMRCTDDITSARASEAALREMLSQCLAGELEWSKKLRGEIERALTADPTGQEGERERY